VLGFPTAAAITAIASTMSFADYREVLTCKPHAQKGAHTWLSMKYFIVIVLSLLTPKLLLAEPVVLVTKSGALYGTLEIPQTASSLPCPIALIIAGSGPTNRDGNTTGLSGANHSLKLLAQGLVATGIASVRYDKRGVGESAKAAVKESDLRFDTLIDDAVLWGRRLRQDKRFSSLIIIGHSEGSLIGIVAARKLEADALVSIAGAGRPIAQIILEQVRPQLSPALMKQTEEIVRTLTKGKTAPISPELNALFRPSVQPYLISWFRYDPAQELRRLSVPVLIVQGTTDIQLSVREAELLAKAKPSARLLIIEGMNHVLKAVSNDRDKQLSSYVDPTLPIVPALVRDICFFIAGLKPTNALACGPAA